MRHEALRSLSCIFPEPVRMGPPHSHMGEHRGRPSTPLDKQRFLKAISYFLLMFSSVRSVLARGWEDALRNSPIERARKILVETRHRFDSTRTEHRRSNGMVGIAWKQRPRSRDRSCTCSFLSPTQTKYILQVQPHRPEDLETHACLRDCCG